MIPESIDTNNSTDAQTRSEPFDGIKAYLKLSGWLVLSAIGFLALHFVAMFATTSPDEFAGDCKITAISCDGTAILDASILAKCQRAGTIEYVDHKGCPLSPRESKWVEIRHRRADYVEGNENYVTTLPVEELRLYVTHPPGFQVWATSMHPDEAELFSDTAISKGWALCGLIPGQGLAFMWRRIQPYCQTPQPSGTDENEP
jgi:hypothetical protein